MRAMSPIQCSPVVRLNVNAKWLLLHVGMKSLLLQCDTNAGFVSLI